MLSNVGRHAQASSVAIHIVATAEAISIRVSDNGRGAEASAFEAADAYGVMGMRERALHLGGSIDISSETVRILIGDDHRIVREGLKQVLADAPEVEVVAEAETGPDILARVDALGGNAGLDAVLLDIALPDRDGMDVLQALKKSWP
eukprot:gene2534-3168_t